MSFPNDFAWGVATAAYQIEGAAFEDGKGASVWDMMVRKENTIWRNQRGDVACDHYHRYEEDVALMKQIGIKAYRLSLSWSRVLPEGTGAVNPKGIAFYDRLIDELLAANITPYVTLFHWDYPLALYYRGGWLNAESPDWFAEYAAVTVDRLSDRVQHWMTLNEPQCFVGLGHRDGNHAPGDKLGWAQVLRIAHHSLLAHGKAVQVIRARAKTPSIIGFAPVGVVSIPASQKAEDIEAARTAMFSIREKTYWVNTWFADPIFLKEYPSDGLEVFGEAVPQIGANDMDIIAQPLDFYGCNIYSGGIIQADEQRGFKNIPQHDGSAITLMHWDITPEALYWGPRFFYERYGKPIIITENGISIMDWIASDGKVHDPQRIDYVGRHLSAIHRVIENGVPVQGYFHWTLMDNFEWQEGFKQRFGFIYVDYPTQRRVLKDSAYWYRDVIRTNGKLIEETSYPVLDRFV